MCSRYWNSDLFWSWASMRAAPKQTNLVHFMSEAITLMIILGSYFWLITVWCFQQGFQVQVSYLYFNAYIIKYLVQLENVCCFSSPTASFRHSLHDSLWQSFTNCVYLSIYLSIDPSIYLSVYLCIYLYISLSVCLSIWKLF